MNTRPGGPLSFSWLVGLAALAGCSGSVPPEGSAGSGGSAPAGGTGGAVMGAGGGTGGSGAGRAPVGADDQALVMLQAQIAAAKIDKSQANWRTLVPQPTVVPFTAGKSYLWILSTNKGEMRIQLRPDVAPMHVT